MTRIVGILIATLLVSPGAAQELNRLIEQNVKSQRSSSKRLVNEPAKTTPRLWIHARGEEQKRAVEGKIEWFKNLTVEGLKIELRPIAVVKAGPRQTELRFFRRTDEPQAQALLAGIKKGLPLTVLKDMSSQYQKVTWIEPGHYELWLAPNVTKFSPVVP